MKRDSCVFYRSFYEAIDDLDDASKLACYNAIFKYALDGEEPLDKGIVSAFFKLVRPVIDKNNESYKNGQKGGRPKTEKEPNENPIETQSEPNDIPNKDVDVDKDEELKENKAKEKQKRFSKPTVEDVRKYCLERQNGIDPEEFVDFYESKGWRIGEKSPMKDWKAAVRTWEKKNKTRWKPPNKSFESQRNYNYDALERAMLERTQNEL